jgi:hypothetical protein
LGSGQPQIQHYGENNMEAYHKRVMEEKYELESKIEKLVAFILTSIFEKLPEKEKDLLLRQEKVMREYADILDQRIINYFV